MKKNQMPLFWIISSIYTMVKETNTRILFWRKWILDIFIKLKIYSGIFHLNLLFQIATMTFGLWSGVFCLKMLELSTPKHENTTRENLWLMPSYILS